MQLLDRVAVVTGAASGLGRAVAEALAAHGARLALVDVDVDGLAAVATSVRTDVSTHRVDVADATAMEALADATIARHGGVDVLVNNAGVTAIGALATQRREDIDWVVRVNLGGTLNGCRAFLPHFVAAGAGHVVNVSSAFGLTGLPLQAAYCATKYAIRGLTESLWEELDGTGVGVTLVHPATFATGIARHARGGTDEERSKAAAAIAAGGRPQDAAEAIVDAIRAGRRRVLVGRSVVAIDVLKRLWPVGANRLIAREAARRMGLGH